MSQLCGLTAKELFITNEGEKAVALQLAENSPKVELSLVDLQWLQVLRFLYVFIVKCFD